MPTWKHHHPLSRQVFNKHTLCLMFDTTIIYFGYHLKTETCKMYTYPVNTEPPFWKLFWNKLYTDLYLMKSFYSGDIWADTYPGVKGNTYPVFWTHYLYTWWHKTTLFLCRSACSTFKMPTFSKPWPADLVTVHW